MLWSPSYRTKLAEQTSISFFEGIGLESLDLTVTASAECTTMEPKSVLRNRSHWIWRSNAFLPDLALQQERIAVYR